MDINNDLQQINTFVKGMNTDVSDALMDSSQYRYAENVRLATNKDENTGELRLIEGTDAYANLSNFGDIVAMTSIRDILIVVTEQRKDNYGKARNLVITKDSYYGDDWNLILDTGYEGSHFGHEVSLVTRWESEKNVKLYIADGAHGIMSINIRNMELDENGVVRPLSGIEDVNSESGVCLDPPTIQQIYDDNGAIPYVKVQYAYRLYNIGGISTQLSPLSEPVVLYKTASEGYALSDKNTGKSIQINIPNQTDFDYLEIYRIGYVEIGQQGDPKLIYDNKFRLSFKDSGGEVQELSDEDFKSLNDTYICPTIIESKEDRLFAANIKDFQQQTDQQFDIDFRAKSSGNVEGGEYIYNKQFDNINNYNEDYWKIPGTDTIGGDCDYISWQFDYKDIYIDTNNSRYNSDSDFPNSPIVNPKVSDVVSLRPGEVYRYGAVLYLSNGRKTSTKWIADIMVPPEYDVPERIRTNDTKDITLYKFKRIGIHFNIKWNNIPSEVEKIEIVRAERTSSDKITITQGIAGYPMEHPTGHITPHGLLALNKFVVWVAYYWGNDVGKQYIVNTQTQYMNFATPEYSYTQTYVKNLIDSSLNNLYIQPNYYLKTPIEFTPSEDRVSGAYNYEYFCRPESEEGNITNADRSAGKTSSIIFEMCGFGEGRTEVSDTFIWIYHTNDSPYPINSLFTQSDQHPWFPFFQNYIGTTGNVVGAANMRNPKAFLSKPKIIPVKECKNKAGNNINFSTDVVAVGYTKSMDAKSLFDDDYTFSISNPEAQSETNGGATYTNWTATAVPDRYNTGTELYNDVMVGECVIPSNQMYPIGSNGRCIILKTNNSSDFCTDELDMSNAQSPYATITAPVLSLKRKTASPYNGDVLIDLQSYVSYGNTKSNGDSEIYVYDGDCYPGIYVYNSAHMYDEANLGNSIGQACVYTIPLYSDIDLSATSGWLYNRLGSNYYTDNRKYLLQDKADVLLNFEQSKDMYEYRTEYGAAPNTIEYSTVTYTEIEDSKFDTRVFYSEVKKNNERIDNWLKFKPLNFLDVDSRFGQITNMRLFKDKLLFWQEHAMGILSVNERTVLNDTDSNEIIVGSGGVLSRFDYISTVYGMKPYQYEAETQSNYTQYWWDGYNKELLAYTGGMELVPLTKSKGCTNYINEREESEHPSLTYDNKYDELIAQVVKTKESGESLVYNEQIQGFSSIYTFVPQYRALIDNNLYITDNNTIYNWNKQHIDNYSLLFNKPAFPKVRTVINKNNIYTKTFDNLTFGGRMYKGSLPTITEWPMERGNGEYVEGEHLNAPMHHLIFTFETPLKQKSAIRGDKATSVDEYDYRLAIPRNGSQNSEIEYGNRMRGKTMQCEIASDYNSTDFSLQYITTKFRMSWS